MLRTSRQPILRLLLVIAGVHQLGACACGCLEHNGWVQLIGGLAGSSETTPGDRDAAFDHQHCHSAEHAPARVSPRVTPPKLGETLLPAEDALVVAGGRMARIAGLLGDQADAARALPMRANLQVFRL